MRHAAASATVGHRGVGDFRLTSRAHNIVAAALKDRPNPVFVAIRTYHVKALIGGWKILHYINKAGVLGFPEHILGKLGLAVVLRVSSLQQLRQLDLKFRIRELRVCYLHYQVRHQAFNLAMSSRLRRLEKALDADGNGSSSIGGFETSSEDIENIRNQIGVHVKFLHDVELELRGLCAGLQWSDAA